MTNAVIKMEVGPPLALYRRSQQITLRCWGSDFLVSSVKEKVPMNRDQIRIEKMNVNEPLMKYRENEQSVKTAIRLCLQDKSITENLIYWLCGRRYISGMISI